MVELGLVLASEGLQRLGLEYGRVPVSEFHRARRHLLYMLFLCRCCPFSPLPLIIQLTTMLYPFFKNSSIHPHEMLFSWKHWFYGMARICLSPMTDTAVGQLADMSEFSVPRALQGHPAGWAPGRRTKGSPTAGLSVIAFGSPCPCS